MSYDKRFFVVIRNNEFKEILNILKFTKDAYNEYLKLGGASGLYSDDGYSFIEVAVYRTNKQAVNRRNLENNRNKKIPLIHPALAS